MTYKELEDEVKANQRELMRLRREGVVEGRKEPINRNHDLIVEMDRRWNAVGDWWKK